MALISSCVSFEKSHTESEEDESMARNISELTNFGVYENLNKFYNYFDLTHTWLSLTLCCCGLAANVFTVAVLTRRTMASVVNRLLTAVAVCDSCLLTFYLIFVLHFKFLPECPVSQFSYKWTLFALVHANLSIVLRASSLWLSVVVAGYRKSVLYLNPANLTESQWTAPCAVAITVISVTLVAIPIFLGNAIHQELSPLDGRCPNDTNRIFYRVVPSDYSYAYDCFLLKINHFINAVLLKLMPLCFLTYYLISIIRFFCRRSRFRRQSLYKLDEETSCQCFTSSNCFSNVIVSRRCSNSVSLHPTTVILAAILLMTILCEMPNAATSALSSFLSSEFYWFVYRNLGDVFDVLSLFNGLTTFSMYCIMSGAFRTTFVELFRRKNSERFPLNASQSQKLKSNLVDKFNADEASVLLEGDAKKKIKKFNNTNDDSPRFRRESSLAPDNNGGNETANGIHEKLIVVINENGTLLEGNY